MYVSHSFIDEHVNLLRFGIATLFIFIVVKCFKMLLCLFLSFFSIVLLVTFVSKWTVFWSGSESRYGQSRAYADTAVHSVLTWYSARIISHLKPRVLADTLGLP
jgi:hypothetical protein